MKLMIMAGGTGGHVYPALAVAQRLRALGHEIVWMGAPDSFEARVVPAQGIALECVQVSGLRGKGVLKLLLAPLLIARAVVQAWAIVRRVRPDVVLGMGGFAAGPGGLATWLARRPLVIHEQNAAAGLTNRALAHLATSVLQAFPGTFPGARTVGNPVRAGFAELPAPAERLDRSGPPRVLVIGGSQGAKALNERVAQALAKMTLAERPAVKHQAGRTLAVAQQAYLTSGVIAEITAFIDDMPAAMEWADLVICRAGASTIAELGAAGMASVLVPFPAAVDDHQTRNAEYLVRAGAALLIPESELSAERLADVLRQLLSDRSRLLAMASAARSCAWSEATAAIADECLRLADGGAH